MILSHKEVAKKIGVSLSTYYRWISGESKLLKHENLNRLSELLDCDVEFIIDESNRVKVKADYDLWSEQDIEDYIEIDQA